MTSTTTPSARFGSTQGISKWDLLNTGGYPADYPTRKYYVNNISGASTNDGLSWEFAFAQPSQAITAWAAYLAGRTSTDAYVRGIIYIQGTGTAYTAITAWPQYCDMIGVGADPRGNGTGIARITGSTSAAAAGAARGLNLRNIQFIGSGNYYAATFSVLYRSTIENCTFVNGATGGLDITTGGGFVIRNCQIGGGDTTLSVTGLRIAAGATNFNNCLVEDNVIYGSTTGFYNKGYLCNSTVVRNNIIMGGTTGIYDESTHTTIGVLPMYVGNYVWGGTDAISCANGSGANTLGNFVADATEARIESTPIVTTST